jgi:hypothetical protein
MTIVRPKPRPFRKSQVETKIRPKNPRLTILSMYILLKKNDFINFLKQYQ